MDLKTLKYQVKDNVALITLFRPEQYNAVNSVMSQELPKVWNLFDNDPEAIVAIITGQGEKSFCTGADLTDLPTMDNEQGKATLGSIKWTSLQNDIWKPVICAVNGMTCGGGLHFVADSDIILCSSNSTFFDTHVKVGLVAGLEPVGLSRRASIESILRMALVGGNERMSADKALSIGLVGEVVDQGSLLDRAFEIAGMIKGNSPSALEKTKKAIWNSKEVGMSKALEYAWGLILEQNIHPDFEEGSKAFIEKRNPNWVPLK
jgi:enoyl-CoA hydratase/carnithine racemase